MWKRISFFLLMGALLFEGWFWFERWQKDEMQPPVIEQTPLPIAQPEVKEEITPPIIAPPKEITETFHYTVPFTSQAPTGDWSQSVFQDGCEETSALMVWMAKTGKTFTREEVKAKLIDMAKFEEKNIGHGVDTDANDTNQYLLDAYFGITDAQVKTDITLAALKQALLEGLIIVPTNGRALKNPNFTAPGPLEHMLVIKGYDAATKEFITNDPGTRKGENYRYPEQVLFDAIREYPTGKHLPIITERKSMIVIPFDETSVK